MTTIVGVKTPSGIVIAADSRVQRFDAKGKEIESLFQKKIHTGPYHAMASSGWHDTYYDAFEEYMDGEIGLARYLAIASINCKIHPFDHLVGDVRPKLSAGIETILEEHPRLNRVSLLNALRGEKSSHRMLALANQLNEFLNEHYTHPIDYAVQDETFREIALLNRLRQERFREHVDEKPDSSELLLAINDPKLELYLVEGNGVMKTPLPTEDIMYLARGSGKEDAEDYIDNERWRADALVKQDIGVVRGHKLRLNQAIWLALGAVLYASAKDSYTGGPVHLAVVEKDGVTDHADSINRILTRANLAAFRKVARAHTKRK